MISIVIKILQQQHWLGQDLASPKRLLKNCRARSNLFQVKASDLNFGSKLKFKSMKPHLVNNGLDQLEKSLKPLAINAQIPLQKLSEKILLK